MHFDTDFLLMTELCNCWGILTALEVCWTVDVVRSSFDAHLERPKNHLTVWQHVNCPQIRVYRECFGISRIFMFVFRCTGVTFRSLLIERKNSINPLPLWCACLQCVYKQQLLDYCEKEDFHCCSLCCDVGYITSKHTHSKKAKAFISLLFYFQLWKYEDLNFTVLSSINVTVQ